MNPNQQLLLKSWPLGDSPLLIFPERLSSNSYRTNPMKVRSPASLNVHGTDRTSIVSALAITIGLTR